MLISNLKTKTETCEKWDVELPKVDVCHSSDPTNEAKPCLSFFVCPGVNFANGCLNNGILSTISYFMGGLMLFTKDLKNIRLRTLKLRVKNYVKILVKLCVDILVLMP